MRSESKNQASPLPGRATGLRRVFYIAAGVFFLILGLVGVILPVLPTTPFLLLASFFFVRSSPRLNRWMLRSRIFGPFLRDWQEKRGIRRSVRWAALVMIVIAISASVYFGELPLPLVILLCVLGLIGAIVVLRLPVIDETKTSSCETGKESPALTAIENSSETST